MKRIIAHFLILLVLFTHSTMAMDVHIPHMDEHSTNEVSFIINANSDSSEQENYVATLDNQELCSDAGGHCSHHQAHSTGLLSISSTFESNTQAVLISILKSSALLHPQAPPVRPPKA